jgi:hypothetical protein
MSAMSEIVRGTLLDHIAALATDADGLDETIRVFLPLPNHLLALRPEVVIVEGTRGAGKTALFQLVTAGRENLREFFSDSAIPVAKWIDAFSEQAPHPSSLVLDQFVSSLAGASDAPLRTFWAVHLLECLSRAGVSAARLPTEISNARGYPSSPAEWVPVAERQLAKVMACLDLVDSELSAHKELVFASYDHLDRIGLLEPNSQIRERLIRALVALWLSLSTRYRSLRSKIFLRPDLFEQAQKSFPDASKLRSRSVSLDWDVDSLFRLTVRHLSNRGPHVNAMVKWLRSAGIALKDHPGGARFGLLPEPLGEEGQRAFAEQLAGAVMGSGPKKGYTYRWIPARLKDAGGRIVPRSFLRLFGYAAREARLANVKGDSLMSPAHLVGALVKTSEDRVRELQEEYEFVGRLVNLKNKTMLMERKDVVKLLAAPASTKPDGFGKDGEAVFRELSRIGVFETRSNGRIDVPDIYRYGYDIKRSGGAKRPR